MTTHVEDTDRLITRLVDDEASDADRRRFEALAAGDPELWRTLAVRLQDMQVLAREFEDDIADALRVELPELDEDAPASIPMPAPRSGWTFAAVGWAAVLVLGVMWATVSNQDRGSATAVRNTPAELSPDQHLDRYQQAPFFVGELQPMVLQIEQMSDGRYAVRFLRRFEEVAFFEPEAELPIDEQGYLVAEPASLRVAVPPPPPTSD